VYDTKRSQTGAQSTEDCAAMLRRLLIQAAVSTSLTAHLICEQSPGKKNSAKTRPATQKHSLKGYILPLAVCFARSIASPLSL